MYEIVILSTLPTDEEVKEIFKLFAKARGIPARATTYKAGITANIGRRYFLYDAYPDVKEDVHVLAKSKNINFVRKAEVLLNQQILPQQGYYDGHSDSNIGQNVQNRDNPWYFLYIVPRKPNEWQCPKNCRHWVETAEERLKHCTSAIHNTNYQFFLQHRSIAVAKREDEFVRRIDSLSLFVWLANGSDDPPAKKPKTNDL